MKSVKLSEKIRKRLSTEGATANSHHGVMPRGGRLRYTGRGVATYAPWLGMVTAVADMGAGMALGAGDVLAHGTHADDARMTWDQVGNTPDMPHQFHPWCKATPGGSETNFECSGSGATRTQSLKIPYNAPLTVAQDPGFSVTVAEGNAFHITNELEDGNADDGESATVTLSGMVTATAGHGIYVKFAANGGHANPLTRTTGAVTAGMDGIHIESAVADVAPIHVTVNGAVTAIGTGVFVNHEGGEEEDDRSTITVTLGDSVTGRGGTAVELMGGSAQKLVLSPGAGSFMGDEKASRDDAVLELIGASGATESTSFVLTQLSSFTKFLDLDKSGTGTWTPTGMQGASDDVFEPKEAKEHTK